VTFFLRADDTVEIGGSRMGAPASFATCEPAPGLHSPSTISVPAPAVTRYGEIRGAADALTDVEPPMSGFSREIIRIHPDLVRSFGHDEPAS